MVSIKLCIRKVPIKDRIKKLSPEKVQYLGSLKLAFGKWQAEKDVIATVGGGYDLLISKNVLKLGYIHPEQKSPGRMLIDLGVDDITFLSRAFDSLNPNGLFLIYNIYPSQSPDAAKYKTWAHGETPWEKEMVESVGWEIVEWHRDDTEAIHQLGAQLGWDDSFESEAEFKGSFNAMVTILKKPNTTSAK